MFSVLSYPTQSIWYGSTRAAGRPQGPPLTQKRGRQSQRSQVWLLTADGWIKDKRHNLTIRLGQYSLGPYHVSQQHCSKHRLYLGELPRYIHNCQSTFGNRLWTFYLFIFNIPTGQLSFLLHLLLWQRSTITLRRLPEEKGIIWFLQLWRGHLFASGSTRSAAWGCFLLMKWEKKNIKTQSSYPGRFACVTEAPTDKCTLYPVGLTQHIQTEYDKSSSFSVMLVFLFFFFLLCNGAHTPWKSSKNSSTTSTSE